MNKRIGTVMLAALLLTASTSANAAPILQSVAPVAIDFVFGAGNDFALVQGTGVGDVTALLVPVDLMIPSPGGSTSGCEAADFSGFIPGSIALIQRGSCTFEQKAMNAESAGAVGVLFFNEGNTAERLVAANVTMFPFTAAVPVLFGSFAVGDLLRTGYTIRMKVAPEDIPVPEPGTIALLGLGLAGLARWRRRRQAR